MKCRTCGGSIIEELGVSPEENRLKCMACGRYVKENADCGTRNPEFKAAKGGEEMKETRSCERCGAGFEAHRKDMRYCSKQCRDKVHNDGRSKAMAESKAGSKPKREYVHRATPARRACAPARQAPSAPVIASPAEIVIALRKGMAAEIVAMINEKYDL